MYDKPKITAKELKEVRQVLASRNFTQQQRDRVEEIFLGDMDEEDEKKGIDARELEERIKWMRSHKSRHGFSDSQIDLIEQELQERL